jgi:hypothetical protein
MNKIEMLEFLSELKISVIYSTENENNISIVDFDPQSNKAIDRNYNTKIKKTVEQSEFSPIDDFFEQYNWIWSSPSWDATQEIDNEYIIWVLFEKGLPIDIR